MAGNLCLATAAMINSRPTPVLPVVTISPAFGVRAIAAIPRSILQREQEPKSPYVLTLERGAPFARAGFAKMVERLGIAARLGFRTHPHMLRHSCGFALANAGHDTRALQAYLGHRNIQHTVRYSE